MNSEAEASTYQLHKGILNGLTSASGKGKPRQYREDELFKHKQNAGGVCRHKDVKLNNKTKAIREMQDKARETGNTLGGRMLEE